MSDAREDSNALDIRWPGKSFCSHEPARLVRWSDGAFVKWECPQCDESRTLSEAGFSALEHEEICVQCRKSMSKTTLPYLNYGYRCEACGRSVRLGDLLPHARRLS